MTRDKISNKGLTLAEKLELAAKHAPKLRAAGVLTFAADGFALSMSPLADEVPELEPDTSITSTPADPLKDKSTFPSGRQPGFPRPPRRF